ncbi:MAG: primosomal protein N' [Paracoccaceae bacterium]|nr:primosomal protein N' [Paracoccaceae bacterium]
MEEIFFEQEQIVTVLTDQPVNGGLLDYVISENSINLGQFVEVPIGGRSCIGVVWDKGSTKINRIKLKRVSRTIDIPFMSNDLRKFLIEVARYTVNPLNKVFKLSLGAIDFKNPPRGKKVYKVGNLELRSITPKRKKVLALLSNFPNRFFTMKQLTSSLDVGAGLINELVSLGNIETHFSHHSTPYQTCKGIFSETLSKNQKLASEQLCKLVSLSKYNTILLRGVTGSGKTEVYLDAISQAIVMRKQILVLVPEIALSIDFVKRVINRYQVKPGEWHSGVQGMERFRLYNAVAKNDVQIVIGARSALFLPFADLGLIIVDEEHDGSYKQEDGVCYNARDMAVMRASILGAQVILASATPSLETWVNVQNGKYRRIDLKERYGDAVLPDIEVVNLREQKIPKGSFISPSLRDEITLRIKHRQQSLLFLNRRGYAPITICQICGFQIGCKICDARLVQHRFKNKLMCHQCGQSENIPSVCPNCCTNGNLKAVGPGVEKIADECQNLFPDARIEILSSDSLEDVSQVEDTFSRLASGEIDIIIGTQIVSKGHNFPNITLVGIIDADLGLQGSDLRAAEKTFQSLRQVSGRAGRHKKVGKALIQTYSPNHPVILAISEGNDDAFWALEANARRKAKSPPYGKMVAFVLTGPNEKILFDIGRKLVGIWLRSYQIDARIFGPALAPVGKIRDRFRVRMLIKCNKTKDIQPKIRKWLSSVSLPRSVKILVDVDPQNFF